MQEPSHPAAIADRLQSSHRHRPGPPLWVGLAEAPPSRRPPRDRKGSVSSRRGAAFLALPRPAPPGVLTPPPGGDCAHRKQRVLWFPHRPPRGSPRRPPADPSAPRGLAAGSAALGGAWPGRARRLRASRHRSGGPCSSSGSDASRC